MSGLAVGQFDFDDGGTYTGGSDGGKAHGFGVCTGPGGQGEYSGAWQCGFELSGVYTWPNGNDYAGQWMQGKRHGLGMERRGHWVYRGEWTQGFMGRYGVRQSTLSEAKYEGTWTLGLHDGYGLETYADGGTYQGQWMKGMRHGYGVRKSATQRKAAFCRSNKARRSSLTSIRSETDIPEQHSAQDHSFYSLSPGHGSPSQLTAQTSTAQIGFFLKGKCSEKTSERQGSFLSRQPPFINSKRQTGVGNTNAITSDKNPKFDVDDDDEEGLVETYTGEWKNDKRSGFGICERSDGLRYEGEWVDNCKNGYGITMFVDGTKEEGKYKNNVLLEPSKRMLLLSAKKIRERIDAAIAGALKTAQIAVQKSDIANSRMESARLKAELAFEFIKKAKRDSENAKQQAKVVLRSEPNASSPSGQTKITKRLSISRHKMLDIQPDQMLSEQQQLNADVLNHIQSLAQNRNMQPMDQKGMDTAQSLKQGEPESNSLQSVNSLQLSAFMEADPMSPRDESLEYDNSPVKYMSRTGSQRLNEADYSQTNHVYPVLSNLNTRNLTRQGSEQLQSNVAVQQSSLSNPITGSQLYLAPSHARRESSEEDHLAEIENIFSYLADEENDMATECSSASSPVSSPREIHSSLLSRPSLRYRRDVHCSNLVILNQETESFRKPVPPKRRLTLPSIIKYGTVGPVAGRGTGVIISSNNRETTLEPKPVETIVIENGVRKRLEEEKDYHPSPLPPDVDPVEEILEPPKELPKRYRLESVKLTKDADLGSLPDVSMFPRLEGRAIPRQEAETLCKRKREELQQLRELEDQMRRRAVVLKIGDLKEWCRRYELTMFLIAVNLILAIMFSKLLSS